MSLKNYLFLFCKFSDVTHYYILESYLDEEILTPFCKSTFYFNKKKLNF
jgi:hypothetical protein